MATILFAWELGGGTGHCVNLLPIVEGLLSRGHQIFLAARDLHAARRVFGDVKVNYLQAPILREQPIDLMRQPRNYAHILHNVGFGNMRQLEPLVAAWRTLITLTAPDLVVAEHAPTALLASRFTNLRRVAIGTGFFLPPDTSPLPEFRAANPNSDRAVEDAILDRINGLLKTEGVSELTHLAQLYADVDENFLLTFAELDHYPGRTDARYWGMWSPSGGSSPSWDQETTNRIFAYLQPPTYSWTPATVLAILRDLRIDSVVYVPGIDERLLRPFYSPHLHFETRRLDITQICNSCRVAITHGNNGTATQFLLGGIPQLLIPIFLEQAIFSRRLVEVGAALIAPTDRTEEITKGLDTLLKGDKHRTAAANFARRYSAFQPQASIGEIVDRIDTILAAVSRQD